MRSIAAFVVIVLSQLSGTLCGFAEQGREQEVAQIVTLSQQAIDQHDEHKGLTLLKEGLVRFPESEEIKLQLARVYVAQKRDRQAIGLLNGILLANPSSRNAKLQLAQIFGYRENYKESDRLYRELLEKNPGDEAAALGLAHNLILQGKKDAAREQLREALARHPTSLELQQYNDFLDASPVEARPHNWHRVQNTE